MRSFVVLRGPCGTFYPHVGCIVRNAHHRSCFFAVQYQIRLVEQPTDVGARSFWTNELETRLHTISQEMLSRARLEELITRFRLYPELRVKAPEAGSYSSALDAMAAPVDEPAMSTLPPASKVALWLLRGEAMLPVAVKLPVAGS